MSNSKNTMQTVAFIFMIIGTVIGGITWLVPLAWCIPMTLHYYKKMKSGEPVSTAFKVCSLIFVSLIGGILMFFDNK